MTPIAVLAAIMPSLLTPLMHMGQARIKVSTRELRFMTSYLRLSKDKRFRLFKKPDTVYQHREAANDADPSHELEHLGQPYDKQTPSSESPKKEGRNGNEGDVKYSQGHGRSRCQKFIMVVRSATTHRWS